MTFAARIRPVAMAAALGACALAMPGFAQTQGDTTPQPLRPPSQPTPVPPVTPPAPLPEGAIGTAEMDAHGTIFLHLKAPEHPTQETWESAVPWPSQERIGYGEIAIDRLNPHYDELLVHLAGLERGHDVTVWPWRAGEEWHCAFDPDRGPCPGLHPVPNGSAQR
jgi:hypothetical protein